MMKTVFARFKLFTRFKLPSSYLTPAALGVAVIMSFQVNASSITVPDTMNIETINGQQVSFDSKVGLAKGSNWFY